MDTDDDFPFNQEAAKEYTTHGQVQPGQDQLHFVPREEMQEYDNDEGVGEYRRKWEDEMRDLSHPPSAAGGGYEEGGEGGEEYYKEEEEYYKEEEVPAYAGGEELKFFFGMIFNGHGNISGAHTNYLAYNVYFQMASALNKFAYKLPGKALKKFITNAYGDKETLDGLKTDLRKREMEIFQQFKERIKFFKDLINPEKSSHRNPDDPEPFIHEVPNNFNSFLMHENTSKQIRKDEFFIYLNNYKNQIIEWCPYGDQTLYYMIEQIFLLIKKFVTTNEKKMPNKYNPNKYNPNLPNDLPNDLPNVFASSLYNWLKSFYDHFSSYNNSYVEDFFKKLRHKTLRGILPHYNLEGNHAGDDDPNAGFSLILYIGSPLTQMWNEYWEEYNIDKPKEHKFNPDLGKTPEGAILRMNPPSPMYSFLRECAKFLNHSVRAKSAYIVFLKKLSHDFRQVVVPNSEYGQVTTFDMLSFVHLLKEIIVEYSKNKIPIESVSVYCYMINCGKYVPEMEDELTEIFKDVEYVPTQTSQPSQPEIQTVEINTLNASQVGFNNLIYAVQDPKLNPTFDKDQIDTVTALKNEIEIEYPGLSQGSLSQEDLHVLSQGSLSKEDFNVLSQISQLSQSATAGGGGGVRVFGGRKTRRNKKPRQKTRRSRKTR